MTAVTDPLSVRMTSYVPADHTHGLNDKQHAALWCDHRELLYGGAAGGGKSDYLLMAALQYVDVPGYSAILFRRSYTDLALPGALMDRAHQWLDDSDAKWHEMDKRWEFPSGASLSFGYLKHAIDKSRYQSAEFQFIGFDELTQFPEEDYLYLWSRLRGPSSGPLSLVPLRMRAASNPGGVGHRWVKDRFIDSRTRGRIFIPASLFDNPHINADAYVEALGQLDEQTRAQLLKGDWSVRGPGEWFFKHTDIDAARELGRVYDAHLAEGNLAPSGGHLSPCIDWGESTQAYTLWPLEGGGVYVPPSEVVASKQEPSEVARRILVRATAFGMPLSHVAYDAAGVQSQRTFMKVAREDAGLPMLKSIKVPFGVYKTEAATYMRRLFERTGAGFETQRIAISPENEELLRQLPELASDPENQQVWVKDEDQHGPDALAAGVAPIARRHRARTLAANGNGRRARE